MAVFFSTSVELYRFIEGAIYLLNHPLLLLDRLKFGKQAQELSKMIAGHSNEGICQVIHFSKSFVVALREPSVQTLKIKQALIPTGHPTKMNAYKKIIVTLLFRMRVTSRRTKFHSATFISGVNVTPPRQSKFCCCGISSSHFGIATLLQLIQISVKCIRSKFNRIVGDPPDENLLEELVTRACPGQHGMLTATYGNLKLHHKCQEDFDPL